MAEVTRGKIHEIDRQVDNEGEKLRPTWYADQRQSALGLNAYANLAQYTLASSMRPLFEVTLHENCLGSGMHADVPEIEKYACVVCSCH